MGQAEPWERSADLTLGSGHGPTSYSRWLTTSEWDLGSLRFVGRFENKPSCGNGAKVSYVVSFRPAPNPSLLLFLAGALTEWALHLTWWSVQRVDNVYLATSGQDGAVRGVESEIRFTTEPREPC